MNIVTPSVEVIDPIKEEDILRKLELCGRTAYKSEDRITQGTAKRFIKGIIKSGHGSVLEHANITVKFICDRGVTHELVRHRLAAYTQESTRYCNYSKMGVQVIEPPCNTQAGLLIWSEAMCAAERYYKDMIMIGEKPEIARSVLPTAVKTEIMSTMNVRQWRHVIDLRIQPDCHVQIIELMKMLLHEFQTKLPTLFEDIGVR